LGKNHVAWLTDLSAFNQMEFRGHTDWLNSACFSADDSKIITFSRDKTAKVWTVDGNLCGTLIGHTQHITDARFSDNSDIVVTVSEDKTIRQWQFGKILNPLAAIDDSENAVFSPDGIRILTFGGNKAHLCDFTGKIVCNITDSVETYTSGIFLKSSEKFCLGTSKGKIQIFNTKGQIIKTLSAHKGKVNSLAVGADSVELYSASDDSLTIMWNTGSGIPEKIFKAAGKVSGVSLASSQVVYTDNLGYLYVCEDDTKKVQSFKISETGIKTMEYIKNRDLLAILTQDKKVKFVDLVGVEQKPVELSKENFQNIDISPDGRSILTVGSDMILSICNFRGKEILKLKGKGKIENIAFSSDNKYVLAVQSKGNERFSEIWVIDPLKVLELTNRVKIFGDFETFSEEKLLKFVD
jgi:WD40 repeat protein